MTVTATTDDLHAFGWARSFTGFWVSPDAQRIVSEADALQEVARILHPPKKEKR
jgi:hypothetical protein